MNVFKHFNLPAWKKASKEGDVTPIMVSFKEVFLVEYKLKLNVSSLYIDKGQLLVTFTRGICETNIDACLSDKLPCENNVSYVTSGTVPPSR